MPLSVATLVKALAAGFVAFLAITMLTHTAKQATMAPTSSNQQSLSKTIYWTAKSSAIGTPVQNNLVTEMTQLPGLLSIEKGAASDPRLFASSLTKIIDNLTTAEVAAASLHALRSDRKAASATEEKIRKILFPMAVDLKQRTAEVKALAVSVHSSLLQWSQEDQAGKLEQDEGNRRVNQYVRDLHDLLEKAQMVQVKRATYQVFLAELMAHITNRDMEGMVVEGPL